MLTDTNISRHYGLAHLVRLISRIAYRKTGHFDCLFGTGALGEKLEIKKKIIDSIARINVRENLVPPESKENAVAKISRNISRKAK